MGTLTRQPYPILEFDPAQNAFIDPQRVVKRRDVPQHAVICFFNEVIQQVVAERQAKVVFDNRWEDGPHPLYEIEHAGRRVAFFHPGIGGALAAGMLEEMIAVGCRKFIVCGGCGVLDKDIAVGHLVAVSAALRDEGTSYHYLPPSREIPAQPRPLAALEAVLQRSNLPYRRGKTWTTDAPYRETTARIAARREEGCLVVEMEAAALLAVAAFRNVALGYILYGGDDLSGDEWDNRGWQSRAEIRQSLFWLAVDACLAL